MYSKKIKIKLLSVMLIFSILIQFILPLTSFAADINVSLTTTATSLKAGDTINVNIIVTGGQIGYFSAYLDYDTDIFENISKSDIYINSKLTSDEDYGMWIKTCANTSSGDKISISESIGDAYEIPDNGLLGTIKFKVKENADLTRITFNNIALVDENNKDIDKGSVSIDLPKIEKKYTITYNSNSTDIVNNMPTNTTKVEDVNCLIADAPSRTGYTFTNWNTKEDGTGISYAAGSVYSTNSDLNLYAQWELVQTTLTVIPNGGVWEGSSSTQTFTQGYGTTKTIDNPKTTPNGYVVRFNSNGGTTDTLQITQKTTFDGWTLTGAGALNGTTYTFGDTVATLTANYTGDKITLPNATKTGATFKGWYTSATGGTRVGGAGDIYVPTSTMTLSAQWDEIEYTLTINPNGGTYNGQTTVTGGYDSTVAVTNPTAPKGYKVTLNNNDETGKTTQVVQTMKFDKWVVTGKGSLSGITYTFGDGNGTLTATYTSNNVELDTPTRTGYTFDGWYTLAKGGTKIDSPYMPTNDIILYAHWTANTYEITFNPGKEGTVSDTTKEVRYGETYGTLPTPTRPGFDFDGWADENGNVITKDDIVNITKDATLTAKWLGAEYTVTFNPDGGELDTTRKTVRNEGIYGELPIPTKTGYTFKGWYDSNGNKIENTTKVDLTEDITLIAKWEENTYRITFDAGEGTADEKTKEVKYGEKYGELPTPTRPGYEFNGWLNSNGDEIKAEDIVNITEDTTLTANWTGKKYTLTFDYEGGTGNITNKTIENGQVYGELPEATKEGHTFLGWFDEEGNKVTRDTIVNTTTNVTAYAKYEKEIYTVTFKNDDGTILSQTPVKYGENVEYKGETPVKSNVTAGYKATFAGWNNANNLQNVTENREVVATYEISPIEYKITYYNLKDSDNSANPTTYTINTPDIILVNLSNQPKYIFKGWYTSNDKNGIKVTSIDTSKLGNIVLYAQWENDELYYKSEKYKVGENNIDNYEQGDIYLDKIEPNTTVKELIENSDTNGIITIIDANGNELKENDLVGTGMTIKITRYDEEITMTTVVMGDLDGNGKVTATDLSTLNQAILKITTLEGAAFKAADLDDNEKLTATDLSTINNTILENITLTYDKKQIDKTSTTIL